MSYFLKNTSIVLQIDQETHGNASESWIYILEARNEVRSPLLDWPEDLLYGCMIVVLLCTIIISYFRYILYNYLYGQYSLKVLKPIDILTLLHALADHATVLCMAIIGSLICINGKSLQDISGGTSYCVIHMYIVEFGRTYTFIGSLMMSLYRILLIKYDQRVVHYIGTKNLFRFILILGTFLTLTVVVSQAINDYEQVRRNTCQQVYRKQILLFLDEYEQGLGRTSILSYWQSVQLMSSYGRIFTKVAEIIIYIILFHEIYKNDNSPGLRRLLEPEVISGRNRRNAITFFGQFCSFMFELSWTVVYIFTIFVATRTKTLIISRFAIRMVTATCMPIIEVVTSNTLRKRICKFVFYDCIFGIR